MQIISGTELALKLKQDIAATINNIKAKHNFQPTIATIIVGDNPASLIYVNRKYKEAIKIGINVQIIKFERDISQKQLLDKINLLNSDNNVHAILVQLPLPTHLNTVKIINAIEPDKDVDGLTSINAGKIATGDIDSLSLLPCTPAGSIMLCKKAVDNLVAKNVVVIGKSNLVGKPLAILLLHLGCTVTVVHKATQNIAKHTQQADVIFIAAGSPRLISADMIKQESVIIDIGITKENDKILGDCNFESCKEKAGFITPVPGGVGPMTIAYLLYNTIICAARQNNKILIDVESIIKIWSVVK